MRLLELSLFACPHKRMQLKTGQSLVTGTIRLHANKRNHHRMQKEVKEKPQYAIVASVQLPNVSDVEFEASLTELRELAKTLGFRSASCRLMR